MPRKKGSAAKFMHGATTREEQLFAGRWGPIVQSHAEEIEFMGNVGIVFHSAGRMEEWKMAIAAGLSAPL